MKRDKLFDIEIYGRSTIFDCSLSDVCVNKKRFFDWQTRDMPLFMEDCLNSPFCTRRSKKNDLLDAEELRLLQISYW